MRHTTVNLLSEKEYLLPLLHNKPVIREGVFASAMSTSSRQLFNVCDKLIGRRRSSPLPSTHPLHDLPNVFNDYFLQKVQSIRADLDQQSLSLTSCRLTDQQEGLCFIIVKFKFVKFVTY